MGWFGDALKSVGNATADGLTGGLTSGISGAISGIFGGIGAKKRLKRQVDAQKQLNEQAAKLNYEYGEKAAENAYQRQMEMYERSYQDQSYSAMRQQMEDAGLSVSLMYGGGGNGGAGGATTGAPQAETGGAEAGRADSPATQQAAAIQQAQLGLGLVSMKKDLAIKDAQIEEINATAEKQRAEAANITEQKITTMQSRDAIVGKLNQEWVNEWIKTGQARMMLDDNPNASGFKATGPDGMEYTFSKESYIGEKAAADIAKAWAEEAASRGKAKEAKAMAGLLDEKRKGYWTELLNGTIQAKAAATNAAAHKLAVEWETGEYTNKMTWIKLGKEGIKVAIDALKPKIWAKAMKK